jgi:hypothetical protein
MEINFIGSYYDFKERETVVTCMGHEVVRVGDDDSYSDKQYILAEARMKFDEFLAHSFAEWLKEKEITF